LGNSGGFVGPQAFGLCKDRTGEYSYGFLGMAIMLFCGFIGCLMLKYLLYLKKKEQSSMFVLSDEKENSGDVEGEKSGLLIFNSTKTENEHNKIVD